MNARSTVYGPVTSWRFGRSLGVDLIMGESTCSFDCVYCQLGPIVHVTTERREFVPISRVEADLAASPHHDVDVVTFSGSGEPTLALNLGAALRAVKAITGKPTQVLTNATLLHLPEVRADLAAADRVSAKLDAATDEGLRRVNRAAAGVTLARILEGIAALRREYTGKLALQCMFLPTNRHEWDGLIRTIGELGIDEVQIDTPTRPHPRSWRLEYRGEETGGVALAMITPEEAADLARRITEQTGIRAVTVPTRPRSAGAR